ncbi:TolC family protein [Planctomicrobium sp. SH668]|uniref:TolC family protein n=1 Tax=Planctomicrobium sp. SH668 TaxID=3448126 RepID=UPI003F5BF6DE
MLNQLFETIGSKTVSGKIAVALAGAMLVTSTPGCSRTFWREQADRDSYLAITEKLTDPRWELPRVDVTPDPRSRFYDPYNPDCEPTPPDDGAASVYMNWVDGWKGYKGWHKFGQLMSVENPQWLQYFGISPENVDPLTGELMGALPALENVSLPEAVELAQINNRDYQTEIENVYLAALAVTFQRFQFGVRYLGSNGVEPTSSVTGIGVPHGPGDRVIGGVAGGVSQLLPAGTQWAVEFANNTVWLFSGGSQTQSVSNLTFSIVQPLLFGAGRKVGLEGLTQTERNLLYEARVLARLRQEIFTSVVGGPTGFLQLLYSVQQIRNLRGNIGRLEEQIEKLLSQSARNKQFASVDNFEWPANAPQPENLPPVLRGKLIYEADLGRLRWRSLEDVTAAEIQALRVLGEDPNFQLAIDQLINTLQTDVTTLDVLNLQSSLANSTNQLRSLERGLQDDLDSYKLLLGLRTDMVFTIDDSMLKIFELIDPRLTELEERARDFVQSWGALDEDRPDLDQLRRNYVEFLALVDDVDRDGLNVVIEDQQKTRAHLPQRMQEVSEVDQKVLLSDLERGEALLEAARIQLQQLRESVVETGQGLRSNDLPDESVQDAYRELANFRESLVRLTQNLTVIQVSLRVELIEVQPFFIPLQEAVQVAIDNRVDLMNERAYVMDARRKVEIAANALLSNVNIVAEADVGTSGGNRPLDFRGSQTQLRAGFSFTAPLDQIDERNAYRVSLINYQRQRRQYMLAEDRVKQEVRNAWRQLFVLRQNLETLRRAVRIAALQYDSAVEQSNAPASAGASAGRSSGSGLAGNNLLNALNAILNAQNNLVQTYTNYERNRLNIYRDMGIMEIGEDGMWVDPFYRSLSNERYEKTLGPDENLDPRFGDSSGVGRSRVGSEQPAEGMVAVADGSVRVSQRSQESRAGDGQIRTVSGQSESTRFSRQPEKLYLDESR